MFIKYNLFMSAFKSNQPQSKQLKTTTLHPRNRHQGHYQFDRLIQIFPDLSAYVAKNKYGDDSIDFANPAAVRSLNAALLKDYYGVTHWDIPAGFLCPPIPGRADYIHSIADLISTVDSHQKSDAFETKILDVGVGANCIYPIIGHFEYGWSFVGCDINQEAIEAAKNILSHNPKLKSAIELRTQSNPLHIFQGIIQPQDYFHATICNPPFHASKEEALASNRRKTTNLNRKKLDLAPKREKQETNFGGQDSELWCEGGEITFIQNMIRESVDYQKQVEWFSTLVSREESLLTLEKTLKQIGATQYRVLDMSQGQKKSRILAWRVAKKN